MGQRSQIFVRIDNTGRIEKHLEAMYFQWNYGERMISRARYLLGWLKRNLNHLEYRKHQIRKIAEINFDYGDVVDSSDLIGEFRVMHPIKKDHISEDQYYSWFVNTVFYNDNNDGKLFIWINDGKIKYGFTTDDYLDGIMDAYQYLAWDGYDTSDQEIVKFTHDNLEALKNYEVMSIDEIYGFMEGFEDQVLNYKGA